MAQGEELLAGGGSFGATSPARRRAWGMGGLALAAAWGALFSYVAFYLSDTPTVQPLRPPTQAEIGVTAADGDVPADIMQVQRVQRALGHVRPGQFEIVGGDELPSRKVAEVGRDETLPGDASERGPVPQRRDALPEVREPVRQPPQEPVLAQERDAVPVQASAEPAAQEHEGKPPFVGVWGPNTAACGARSKRRGYLPATITRDGARAGGTNCSFRDLRRNGDTWVMAASCGDKERHWSSQVRLVVDGDRLTWLSGKGASTYVRCGRRDG